MENRDEHETAFVIAGRARVRRQEDLPWVDHEGHVEAQLVPPSRVVGDLVVPEIRGDACGTQAVEVGRRREVDLNSGDGVQQAKSGGRDVEHHQPSTGRVEDDLAVGFSEGEGVDFAGGEAEEGAGVGEGVVREHQQWRLRAEVVGRRSGPP